MSDQLFYDSGLVEEISDPIFQSKKTLWILDQNGGSYGSGQIKLDCTSLSNTSAYLDWSSARLVIPFVVGITSSVAINGNDAASSHSVDFAASLKNGSHQLIHSMQCSINGKDVINLTPYLNQFVSYKMLSELSQDDVTTLGQSLLFSPDTTTSITRSSNQLKNNSANVSFTNTTATSGTPVLNKGTSGNKGFFDRLLTTSYNGSAGNLSTVVDKSKGQQLAKNSTEYIVGAVQKQAQVYYMVAVIRLRDVSDLFAKLNFPVRNILCNFTINVNQGSIVHTQASNNTSSVNVQGGTFPVMLNSDSVATNFAIGDITVSCAVGSLSLSGVAGSPFRGTIQSCRLYVDAYEMRPGKEIEYLKEKQKDIVYDDVQLFQVFNVSSGSQINSILTNGITNPKKLLIMPTVSPSSNANVSPLLCANSTEPANTSPCHLTNISLFLGGQNILNNLEQYSFEHYLNNVMPESVLNGGRTNGIISGLYGETDWFYSPYYVFNLSRRRQETTNQPLSVQVQATNASLLSADYNCFITHERSFKLDVSNGQIM